MSEQKEKPKWTNQKGYRHFFSSKIKTIKIDSLRKKLLSTDKLHNFFPMLRYEKVETKYKKQNVKKEEHDKCVYCVDEKGKIHRSNYKKRRCIEYASHLDATIYGFYTQEIFLPIYDSILHKDKILDEAIIAYRKIPTYDNSDKNKSTIEFSKEVFDFVIKTGECYALTFDIKNFFPSLCSEILKKSLIDLLGEYNPDIICDKYEPFIFENINKNIEKWKIDIKNNKLPPTLYHIFKNITNYSSINLNDLKINGKNYDEKKLAEIRKKGINAFFENPKDMRRFIKEHKIRIHKNKSISTTDNKQKKFKGIPQGSPISACFANIYMLSFDREIIKGLSEICADGFLYRRYCDDMIVVFKNKEILEKIRQLFNNQVKKINLELSMHKTESFSFVKENDLLVSKKEIYTQYRCDDHKKSQDTGNCSICSDEIEQNMVNYPLTYLGLEFYGQTIQIKPNKVISDVRIKKPAIQKFYRELDMRVKRQVKRSITYQNKHLLEKPIFFKRKLYRDFTLSGVYLSKKIGIRKMQGRLLRLKFSKLRNYYIYKYDLKYNKKEDKYKSNFTTRYWGNKLSFAKRCDYIFYEKMGDSPRMLKQFGNTKVKLKERINYWFDKLC